MIFVLRAEYKETEKRTPLIPIHAKELISEGHQVFVEDCHRRVYSNEEYKDAGCHIIQKHSWQEYANKPGHIILGLKELPLSFDKIEGKHIYFAHIYKGQEHSKQTFEQYQKGSGLLYDLEFLQDQSNRRVAAFGYWAGYVGAALSFWELCLNQSKQTLKPLSSFKDQNELIETIKKDSHNLKEQVKAIIIGASGRCGTGASAFLDHFNCSLTKWDAKETAPGGPFKEIGEHHLFINCVYLSNEIPPFLDKSIIEMDQLKLKVIGDVSCDPNGPWNPVRIYNQHTSWESPALNIENKLKVIAIDNLPSLLPKESSEDFSGQLLPSLKDIDTDSIGTWQKAKGYFEKNKADYI